MKYRVIMILNKEDLLELLDKGVAAEMSIAAVEEGREEGPSETVPYSAIMLGVVQC